MTFEQSTQEISTRFNFQKNSDRSCELEFLKKISFHPRKKESLWTRTRTIEMEVRKLKVVIRCFSEKKHMVGGSLELVKVAEKRKRKRGSSRSSARCGKVTKIAFMCHDAEKRVDSGSEGSGVKKFSQTSYGGLRDGWGPWKASPGSLCVNTESLTAIKAISAWYLTAFKVAQSSASFEHRYTKTSFFSISFFIFHLFTSIPVAQWSFNGTHRAAHADQQKKKERKR